MLGTDTWERLRHFRQALYDDLGLRQDSLFELVDAVLTASHRSTLVRLSLTTAFRRRWPSTCDALADGSVDETKLRTLFASTLVDSAVVDGRPLWVIDGTNWPRPAARASADRTWEYRPLPGWPQNSVVPAWAYQWLVAVPDVAGSCVLPLDVHRVVYRAPEPQLGRGRPRVHGEPFRLADETTHGRPQSSTQLDHSTYGLVTIDVWTELHVSGAPNASFSVIRVQVERLPNKKLPPRPLWLAWIGGALPADLSVVWRWYLRWFTVEHAFRFFKQTLGWTTVRPRHPEAADRWTWLIAAACWQLWQARPLVGEVRLPWEYPRPDGLVTPGQVHRHFTGILVWVNTPARAPRRRGNSPGRQFGQRPTPSLHYEVARRAPPRAA